MSIVNREVFRDRLVRLERWIWSEGAAGLGLSPPPIEVLARRVDELSDIYTVERDRLGELSSRRGHLLPKLLYFLCSDAPKVHLVLAELAERRALPPAALRRVVDVGCGVGATAAGLLLSLDVESAGLAGATIELRGLDLDPAVFEAWRDVVKACAGIVGVAVRTSVAEEDLRSARIERTDSLLLCQAALNECLDGHGDPRAEPRHSDALVDLIGDWAAERPVALIEPALRIVTRPLHALRDAVLERHGGLTTTACADREAGSSAADAVSPTRRGVRVLAPCPHQGRCPMLASPRDWCHEVRRWAPTPQVHAVQAFTRRRDDRVKFSFVVLGPAAATEPEDHPQAAGRPSWTGRLVSDAISSKGKVERFVCTDTAALRRLRLLDRLRNSGNALLAEAPRGTMVRVAGQDDGERVAAEVVVGHAGVEP